MSKQVKEKSEKIGFVKFWSWQLRSASMGAMVIILGYLSIYCTDTLGVPAAMVGTLLLASKVFDGVTDILAGFIIDNTNTKLGKARPYELAIFGVWGCTWLLFSASTEWSMAAKCAWIFSMYMLVNSIFATFMYSNQQPYMIRAFKDQNQIIKVNAFGGIIISVICGGIAIVFPRLMATMATSTEGWSRLVGMFALPLLVIGILRFIFVKEEYEVEDSDDDKVTF